MGSVPTMICLPGIWWLNVNNSTMYICYAVNLGYNYCRIENLIQKLLFALNSRLRHIALLRYVSRSISDFHIALFIFTIPNQLACTGMNLSFPSSPSLFRFVIPAVLIEIRNPPY